MDGTGARACPVAIHKPCDRARKSPLNEIEIGDPNHSYDYAIALLARRDYTASELRRKLKERGYIEIAIEPVVEELAGVEQARRPALWRQLVAYRARSRPGTGPHPQ